MSLSAIFRLPVLLATAALALSACAELTVPSYPELRFTDKPAIGFDVAEVEIRQAYKPSGEPPQVEMLFPVRPDQAAESWARDRLQARGADGRLIFTVRDASVTETQLETSTGVTGAFTTEQSERYDARLVLEVQILDSTGRAIGQASARAVRSITVPESASLDEREGVWYGLTKRLMTDMDSQLEQTLTEVFFRFLKE